VRIAVDARDTAKEFILATYGDEFYPPKPRYFKTKASAQDAHEAIRPVDVTITPEEVQGSLPADQFQLYKLIWRRFVASQMAAARFWDTTVDVRCDSSLWRAKGERMLFPGFLKVLGKQEDDENAPNELPKLVKDQELTLEEFTKEQKFTQPPARYSEASLVRELEEKGIGRPSTYAAIISTILSREYVELTNKRFAPTDLGTVVSDLLSEHFPKLMDVGFTAEMEEGLDKVADGKSDWIKLLKDFTADFYPALEEARTGMRRVKAGLDTNVVCEVCGKPMVIKFGRAGTFLACSAYPDCRNTKNFTRNEEGHIEIVENLRAEPEKVGRKCPDCAGDLVIKHARTGSRFIACNNYPDCTYAEPFSTGVACPKCEKGELVEKSSRRGKLFFSCNRYPDCDYALWNKPVNQPCPECNWPILEEKSTKTKGRHLACPEKKCRYVQPLDE